MLPMPSIPATGHGHTLGAMSCSQHSPSALMCDSMLIVMRDNSASAWLATRRAMAEAMRSSSGCKVGGVGGWVRGVGWEERRREVRGENGNQEPLNNSASPGQQCGR